LAKRYRDILTPERISIVNIAMRLVVAGLCGIGLFGAASITYEHAMGIESCPTLGPVPACYIVLSGYGLGGASMFVVVRLRTALFVAGWLPVFGLALVGSSMQVFGFVQCPKSASGIPGCFLSLTLATSLIVAFLVERYYRPKRC
jgi:hypothetical protein